MDHSQLLTQFRRLPDAEWHIGLVVRREYRLVNGIRWASSTTQGLPEGDEATSWKAFTDIVFRGHIYNHGAVPTECVSNIVLGSASRNIRATGDRMIEGQAGGIPVWSSPAPLERIDLSFERSYGGFDRSAYERDGDVFAELALDGGADLSSVSRFSYPRNYRGCGYYVGELPSIARGCLVPKDRKSTRLNSSHG